MRVAREQVPAFADLAETAALLAGLDGLAELEPAAEPFALADGAPLFVQDDVARGAYFVASGELAVTARTPGDGARGVATVGPGGVVGELCLLDHGRRSAEARARGAVRGYRLDYERFSALDAGGSPVAAALLARLRGEVAARIADTLAAMGDDGGSATDGRLPDGATADAGALAALIGAFPGYDRFRDEDWARLAGMASRIEAPRGAVLAGAGEPRDRLLIVARGALREALGDRQMIVHGPGRIASAAAVVSGRPWPTTLAVRENAIVYAVPGDVPHGRRLTELLGLQLTRDLRRLTRERNRALDPALVGNGETA